MRLVLHNSIPEDPELRAQWNGLLNAVERPQVFYTYEWSLAVHRAYRASLQPLLFLAYDAQDSLCGIASLACESNGNVSFLCATTGDYCDFLCRRELKPAFVAAVLQELKNRGVRNITLTNLPEDSGTWQAMQQASRRSGFHAFARTAYVCAQILLEKLERRPGQTGVVLPRKKMLRRFLNAMGREAPVSLDQVRGWDEIKPVLPEFMRAHVARFLLTGRISNLVRPERRTFLEELARLLAESGWITLSRLRAGEKTFAWNYGFQFQDTWFWYQPTFDTDIEKYSPGFCLLSRIVEDAAADPGLKTVDLGLGAEDYKDRLCNQSRRTLYVTLRASAAQHAGEILRYGASRTARASASAEVRLRTSASRLRRINRQIHEDGWIAAATHLREYLWSADEVFFMEWDPQESFPRSGANRLLAIDANQLASAAWQYHNDPETLTYLLRSAARLREGGSQGYVLVDSRGKTLHFGWATEFDGFFLSELNARVDAPAANCVMLFDCWTPLAERGHGHYAEAVTRIAERVREQGKSPWIFSAARNLASLHGLEKTGFQRRYSLIRQRALRWQRIKGETPKLVAAAPAEVSLRAG